MELSRLSRSSRLAGACLAAGLMFTGATTSPVWGASPAEEIRNRLDAQGVSPDKIDLLIAKYEGGIPWESMTPGAVPVLQEQNREAGYEITTKRFVDGSLSTTKVQVANSTLARGSISGCSSRIGTGYAEYTGCLIQRDLVLFVMNFKADYSLYSGSNNDTIRNAYNASYYACLGFCGTASVSVNRRSESGSLPAVARGQMTYGSVPYFTSTYWLELRLLNQSATVAEGQ